MEMEIEYGGIDDPEGTRFSESSISGSVWLRAGSILLHSSGIRLGSSDYRGTEVGVEGTSDFFYWIGLV